MFACCWRALPGLVSGRMLTRCETTGPQPRAERRRDPSGSRRGALSLSLSFDRDRAHRKSLDTDAASRSHRHTAVRPPPVLILDDLPTLTSSLPSSPYSSSAPSPSHRPSRDRPRHVDRPRRQRPRLVVDGGRSAPRGGPAALHGPQGPPARHGLWRQDGRRRWQGRTRAGERRRDQGGESG